MTASSLNALTRKDLAARAKKHQIAGWHEMTKDELVAALVAHFRRSSRNGDSARNRRNSRSPVRTRTNGSSAASAPNGKKLMAGKHLIGHRVLKPAIQAVAPAAVSDALVAVSTDPCWIRVQWTLSRATLDRAEAAMGVRWHRTVPVLRIFDVTPDETGTTSQVRVRDIEIHGRVDHWYLPVVNPPRTYKVEIGYRGPNGMFFVMARSNRVATARPGSNSLEQREKNGKSNGQSHGIVFSKKPSYDLSLLTTHGHNGHDRKAEPVLNEEGVPLEPAVELRLEAELILHGSTDPGADLKVMGDRIPISRDGAFSHRFALPEGRQVIDAVVTTRNGAHQRTIVLGIERNTKELEPQWFDSINS